MLTSSRFQASTPRGRSLILEIQEATKVTVAAEQTAALRQVELVTEMTQQASTPILENENKLMQQMAQAGLKQLAEDNVTKAQEKMKDKRTKLEGLREQLRALVRSGSEPFEGLAMLVDDMRLA